MLCISSAALSHASDSPPSPVNFLHAKYAAIETSLNKNAYNMPLYIESREEPSRAAVNIYGIINYPFESVRQAIEKPSNWCEIVVLHINDKACIHTKKEGISHISLFTGRKFYQHPDDAHRLDYIFKIKTQMSGYLSLEINAPSGPLSTKDHLMKAEIIPLDAQRTLLHLSYSFGYGTIGKMAMKSYFATLGRNKVGFSITGTDDNGAPVHIGGIKGAIERNVVRYYCAVISYLDSQKYPAEQQFEKRIDRWFDLTDMHKKQLHEIEKEKYLSNKRLEHNNQKLLQTKADRASQDHH